MSKLSRMITQLVNNGTIPLAGSNAAGYAEVAGVVAPVLAAVA